MAAITVTVTVQDDAQTSINGDLPRVGAADIPAWCEIILGQALANIVPGSPFAAYTSAQAAANAAQASVAATLAGLITAV